MMSRLLKCLLSLSLAIMIATPLVAADKEKRAGKKKPDPAAAVLKKLEGANLTAEQVTKIKEMAAKTAEKVAAAEAKAGLTDAQKQARRDAQAKAKQEGKSGKEAAEAVKAALKLTPEQEKAMEDARAAQAEMQQALRALLTDEQKQAAGIKEPAKRGGKKGQKQNG